MPPRSWDVVRRWTSIGVLTMFVAACGQARAAAPPTPEFVGARFAAPTVVSTSMPTEPYDPDLESVEATTDSYDPDRLTVVDDAGVTVPNTTGWDAFDASFQRQLGANSAASVAVMVDGEVVHAFAIGERAPGDATTTDDRFRVASVSKVITSIVTLQLVESGRLSLDEPIGGLLVEHLGLTSYDPDALNITVRQLLSHRSGVSDSYSLMFGGSAESCPDAAAKGLQSVGTAGGYDYNNLGFCLLTVVLEAASGMTYERLVYQQLLTPLGINGMRLPATHDLGPDEVQHYPTPGRNYLETLAGAGAWNATPSDLVRILNSVTPGTPGWKALTDDTMAMMRAPAGRSYGLGLIDYGAFGFGHTGTLERTHAMVMVQPNGVTWAITLSGEAVSGSSALRGVMNRALAAGFSN